MASSARARSASNLTTAAPPRRLLLDIRPPDLRSLPWELMTRNGTQLMCVEGRPIARGSSQGGGLPEPEWPLRVLIVDGGEPAGEDIVQAGQEIADIVKVRQHERL